MELGVPTIATSGAAWVRGSQWGAYENTLAVAALKGERVMFMSFDSAGTFLGTRTPTALRSTAGCGRSPTLPNGHLMVTTANGDGADSVLRVRPVG